MKTAPDISLHCLLRGVRERRTFMVVRILDAFLNALANLFIMGVLHLYSAVQRGSQKSFPPKIVVGPLKR